MAKHNIIAIACADIHLQHTAPVWRSAEPDWYGAMKRPLDELHELQKKYNCPILCAGDIFDKWNCCPELINFAISNLPYMFSVCGQHDLPEHNYEQIDRSAYWTLWKAGAIRNLKPYMTAGNILKYDNIVDDNIPIIVYPFSYGTEITPPSSLSRGDKRLNVALVHQFAWIRGYHFDPELNKGNSFSRKNLDGRGRYFGYDLIIYGDNHKGFITKFGETQIINCGSLMRRRSDQIDYRPFVGLIYSDGTIEPYYLDISQDKYLEVEMAKKKETEEQELDMRKFAKELAKLGSTTLDFVEAVENWCDKNSVKRPVRDILRNAMKEREQQDNG